MNYNSLVTIIPLLFIIVFLKTALPTCVLESDFGFIVNCNFKKSGLFRVRNLGGLKAHFGLGFSLGDELGFGESLGNLEANKRRSLNGQTGAELAKLNEIPPTTVPPPLSSTIAMIQPPHKAQAATLSRRSSSIQQSQLMTEAKPLPLGVPAFKPIPIENSNINRRSSIDLTPQTQNVQHQADVTDVTKNSIQSLISPLAHEFTPRKVLKPSLVDLKGHTVEELAKAANVSVDVIQNAIEQRQRILEASKKAPLNENILPKDDYLHENLDSLKVIQPSKKLLKKYKPYSVTKSTHKVMNAPKEYYPVGYEKNFDDNFTAKVDLPKTSFHCGDQKHFPGLYADEDFGCMIFHVCALTDDGLVMKSFLCPESTIFDQTILKCNWWFYVDCKNSKNLYDSNLPVSKSYQLMKALTFFSNYRSNNNTSELPKNINV